MNDSGNTALRRLETSVDTLVTARTATATGRDYTLYRDNPAGFLREVLGAKLLHWQDRAVQTMRDHDRLVIQSANGCGKDFLASGLALFHAYARKGLCLLIAPTQRQLTEILMMGEVRRHFDRGKRPNSETLRLKWEHVSLTDRSLRVYATKTDKTRILPLSDRLLTALRQHFAQYHFNGGSPWLFHHTAADRNAKAGDRINDLRRAFGAAVKRAKLPEGLWPYDLRHSCITRLVRQGKNLAAIQEAAGHATIMTTTIYVHLAKDGSDLRELFNDPTPAPPQADPASIFHIKSA